MSRPPSRRRPLSRRRLRHVAAAAALAALAACEQERPEPVRGNPGPLATAATVKVSDLEPGPPAAYTTMTNPYEGDGSALAEGKRLYTWFNCAGCHGANGGGGMGPPFARGDWIYGGAPENLYASIAQGRPNGMPTFGGLIPDDQIWKLAAYVRSLAPADTAAGPGGSVTPP